MPVLALCLFANAHDSVVGVFTGTRQLIVASAHNASLPHYAAGRLAAIHVATASCVVVSLDFTQDGSNAHCLVSRNCSFVFE